MDIDSLFFQKYKEIVVPESLLNRNYYKEIKSKLFWNKLALLATIIGIILTFFLIIGQLYLNELVNESSLLDTKYIQNLN